ncbi:sensor histidine kinase [Ferdinandcohnia quinoae]|uniref:histidine kinase n=1 Tax=Fredinandcohnia quinoae TaxID=2918902 RepID=A0AAW5E0T5_9BACI|nr:sensor histidine kinase [Fredinandcohnia sp. SECRCQ15]MCH1626521.1 sensor histidine kinase [Fredinandcohnia sp. SECRCQ15]
MIIKFLIERRSWIFLFLFLQALISFVAFIDTTIPIKPILYIVFIEVIIFIVFLIFRFHRETKFYQLLAEREDNLDVTSIVGAERPFEKIVEESIINQIDFLIEKATKNQLALEQEKDELLSWIHEVKTPLTAMQLIIERLEDEEIKAHLKYEWLRIHLLLDQQLHQKRIPFIENDLYIENVELEAILFKEIKDLQSWCMQKGIGFDIDLVIKQVQSDSKWLAFIIRQLLTNAVKYSRESDIIIKSYQQHHLTILEVKDNGRGIDPRDITRIFEKGFTSTSRHHDHAATGMGLYLAEKVAKSLLIKISVKSKLGEGTTFSLTLPRKNEFVNLRSM